MTSADYLLDVPADRLPKSPESSDPLGLAELRPGLEPSQLDLAELKSAHDRIHLMFRSCQGGTGPLSLGDVVDIHARIVNELARQKTPHPPVPDDGLDYASEENELAALQKGLDSTVVEKGLRPLWGSPAGKKLLVKMLVPMVPPHKTYVEPFVGGGAVFWKKEPSEKEVLGDANADLMASWKFAATATDAQIEAVGKFDWQATKANRERVRALSPRTPAERFYKARFLAWSGIFNRAKGSFNPAREGQTFGLPGRLGGESRDRLKSVELVEGDYAEVIKRYDSADTFFFLDPPYVGTKQGVGDGGSKTEGDVEAWDHARFVKTLKGIKGKFLVTYDAPDDALKDFDGFNVRKVSAPHQTPNAGVQSKVVVLISNFKRVSKVDDETRNTGIMVSFDLSPEDAKAIAHDGGEPPEDLHMTLAFLGKTKEPGKDGPEYKMAVERAVRNAVRKHGPLDGEIAGTAKFTAGKEPVFVALFDAPRLPELRQRIVETLDQAGIEVKRDHGYIPHITLAYGSVTGVPDAPISGRKISFKDVSVHVGDSVTRVSLSKALRVEVTKLRGLWGSTAGKSGISGKIVPMIPPHKTYVEPFIGGGAVFFRKGPESSETEVINDLNSEVVHAFKFVRDATPADVAAVQKLDWVVSKETAKKVHAIALSSSPLQRFYRLAYKRFALFMRNEARITAIDPSKAGKRATIPDRFDAVRERLKGVKVLEEDYRKVLSKFDGPDTFFYLDPPYPTYQQEVKEEDFDENAFVAALTKLKGKFLLHYEPRALSKFKRDGWTARIIQTTTTPGANQGGRVAGKLLEVRNYELPTSKVEKADFRITVPIAKVNEEQRIVTGIVLEPDEVDAQNDTVSPEVIERAAHKFLANYQRSTQLGLMHKFFGAIGVELVESWIAKTDLVFGGEKVKKGSWLMSVHVTSDDVWRRVKNGDITGFSIGGTASVGR